MDERPRNARWPGRDKRNEWCEWLAWGVPYERWRSFRLAAARSRYPVRICGLLGEKPLIQWSIEAARASTELDRCIVSTDDEEIADVARSLGADVPYLPRPAEYAQDNTPNLRSSSTPFAGLASTKGTAPT